MKRRGSEGVIYTLTSRLGNDIVSESGQCMEYVRRDGMGSQFALAILDHGGRLWRAAVCLLEEGGA